MSAVPAPRGRAAPRRAQAPRIVLGDEPQFYGPIPVGPWSIGDKHLSDRAKVVLGALGILGRGSQTWVQATIEEVALAGGHSARKARQGLAELAEKGLIAWEAIGDRFRILFRLRGKGDAGPTPPAPRLAPAPDPAPECVPDRVPICVPDRVAVRPPHTPSVLEREGIDDEKPACAGETESSSSDRSSQDTEPTEDVVHEPNYNPNAPLQESPDEDELIDAFCQRCIDLWGIASRSEIGRDVVEYGESLVDYALDQCERMPERPGSYAYARAIMRRQKAAGAAMGDVKPRSERIPASVGMQNYNPGPSLTERGEEARREQAEREREDRLKSAWAGLDEADRESIRAAVKAANPWVHWPSLLEALHLDELERRLASPPEKTPAAGSLAKVPPPPGPEMYCVRTSASYDLSADGSRPDGEHKTPHPAPRDSDPVPPPSGGAPATEATPAPARGGGRVRTPDRVGVPASEPDPSPPARRPAAAAGPKLLAALAAHRESGRASVPAGPPSIAPHRSPAVESDHLDSGGQRISAGPATYHRRE